MADPTERPSAAGLQDRHAAFSGSITATGGFIMKVSREASSLFEDPNDGAVQQPSEWFVIAAELDDILLTFRDFENMTGDDRHAVLARLDSLHHKPDR